jgi:dehydrogenase/reductase SDR family member 7B
LNQNFVKDCASKFALLGYSDSLRAELHSHRNISVINAQPGYINTNISLNALTSTASQNQQNDDEHRNGFDPNYVSRIVIRAIIEKKSEVMIMVLLHRIAIWLRFFSPNLFFAIAQKRGKRMSANNFQD